MCVWLSHLLAGVIRSGRERDRSESVGRLERVGRHWEERIIGDQNYIAGLLKARDGTYKDIASNA